jgi:hypothetical protein
VKSAWATTLVAKTKVAGLLGAALAAGGVGGAVALSHVTPVAQQVVTSASSSPDPETTDAQTPDPETSDAGTPDPETSEAGTPDPETGDVQQPTPADCPSDAKNHGADVSSVAHAAPRGKDGEHGKAVSAAAKSECGKKQHRAGDPKSGDKSSARADRPKTKSAHPKTTSTHHGKSSKDEGSAPEHKSAPKPKQESAPAHDQKAHGSKH